MKKSLKMFVILPRLYLLMTDRFVINKYESPVKNLGGIKLVYLLRKDHVEMSNNYHNALDRLIKQEQKI